MFEIKKLIFADDTAQMAVLKEKLCKLVSEFGRVRERRKLRLNAGKSKVMRCSKYCRNVHRMAERLNDER